MLSALSGRAATIALIPPRASSTAHPPVQQGHPTASSPRPTGGESPAQAHPAGVAALAGAIARGDQEALARLYEARLAFIAGKARRWTGRDESFALDVVQETFVRLITHRASLARLTQDADIDAWLTALARSAAADLLRRELRRAKRERAKLAGSAAVAESNDAIASLEELHRALSTMNDDDRAALRLWTGGSTLSQIAGVFGLTVGSLHGRLRRAVQNASRNDRESDHE